MRYSRLKHIITSGNIIEKGKRKIYKAFLEYPFGKLMYLLPVKQNRIVIDNFGGKGYGDSTKYIADGLIKANSNYDIIWLVDNLSSYDFPFQIKPVKIDSVCALYMRATAKVWIDNVRHLHPVRKKKQQIYLQAWHAPFGPKKAEADAEVELGERYVKEAKYDGQIADGIISNSKLLDDQFRRAFWLSDNVEILRFGLPRNDFLAQRIGDVAEYQHFRKEFKFDNESLYVLYAPTFRDDYSMDGYRLDFEKIANAFSKRFNKKTKIVIRLHPNVASQSDFINYTDDIINGTIYQDMQELSLACDIIVSDYSSCIFDFAILRKPAFICALDLERYKKTRGLLPEFFGFPFPMAESNEQLIDNILKFDSKTYFDKVDKYFEEYPIYDHGDATEKTVKWIQKKIGENK